jgi:glycosyltransferase involved in cell wall biosynthesis
MRILVVSNYFPPQYMGGAGLSAFNSCRGLLQRGIEVSVLVVNNRIPEPVDVQYRVQEIPVHKVTYVSPLANHSLVQTFDPRAYWIVAAEIRRVRPDLVHVHNVSGSTLASFVACDRLDVPVVLTLHDHWLLCPNNMLYRGDGLLCDPAQGTGDCKQCFRRYDFWARVPRRRQVLARLVRNVRLFVSPSHKLVDLHVAAGYDRRRFRVVPNGTDPAPSRIPADPLLREHFEERGRLRTLLFAGAVVETKGIQTLIEALPLLMRYIDRFRLLVAGWGNPRTLAALRRFNPTAVRLLGRVPFEEMRALYAAADLTVVPSVWYDNSPMVIYESLLAGTPIVGSEIGGIPELIRPGQTGYLFPAGDARALTERVIQHFALSAPERRAMRRRCARHVRSELSMDRHLDRLQEVYDEVLGSGAALEPVG